MRRRGDKSLGQHVAFLAETEDHPIQHAELVNWFLKLSLWLDIPALRVVHACWHRGYMSEIESHLKHKAAPPRSELGWPLSLALLALTLEDLRDGSFLEPHASSLTKDR